VASLKELKGRINSVKSTQKITKAKQMVAAAKLRRAQAAAEAARPYATQFANVMTSLAGKVAGQAGAPRLLAAPARTTSTCWSWPTPTRVSRARSTRTSFAPRWPRPRSSRGRARPSCSTPIGRKGRAPDRPRYPRGGLAAFDTTTVREAGYAEAERITEELVSLYEAGKFDVAHLFYSSFRSALVQEPTERQIIPVPAEAGTTAGAANQAAVEYEPDEETILAELLPRYLKTQIFGALLENQASEQGASMTAMDNATRNAGELIAKLTIQYNRSRQAAITTELIEIIAGAEAL
jgi:F-type H+-transporting ATPase subunit gamma